MTPLVSVVIPTRNRPEPLAWALRSVAGQRNLPGAVEAIVVNDGGVEVSSVVDAAREPGFAIRLINLAVNKGLPTVRNIGIDAARGSFLALLDDDDVFLPDHLATMLNTIDRERVDAAYGICAVSTTRVDPSQPYTAPEFWSYPFDSELLSVANFIPVHTAVLRTPPRSARFDPDLPALEDWDMWLRLHREHGYRFHHVPEPTVIYHRIPSQASMVGSTVTDSAALAGYGKLAQKLWSRWPAKTEAAQRFRLYIAVMYWHGLAMLAEQRPLADNYFLRCVGQIAATWYGDQPERDLPERIIESIKDVSYADAAR